MATNAVDAKIEGQALNSFGLTADNTISGLGLNTFGFLWGCQEIWSPADEPTSTTWTDCTNTGSDDNGC